jgi:hypothetical protein
MLLDPSFEIERLFQKHTVSSKLIIRIMIMQYNY